MSQAPRRINTQRSLNRPTEQRPTEAPASRPAPLQGQPDFFEETSVPHPEQRPRPAAPAHPAPAAGTGGNGGSTPPPRRGGAHAAPSEPPNNFILAQERKQVKIGMV